MANKTLKYTNARLMAVQAVYAHTQSGEDWNKLISRFLLEEVGGSVIDGDGKAEKYIALEPADKESFAELVQYVRDNETTLTETIQAALSDNLKKASLDSVLAALLKVGVAEFYVHPDLDTPIIINEYVDLARSFYDGAEVKIANAVLDKVAKVLRA